MKKIIFVMIFAVIITFFPTNTLALSFPPTSSIKINNVTVNRGAWNTFGAGQLDLTLSGSSISIAISSPEYYSGFTVFFRYTLCSDVGSTLGWTSHAGIRNVAFEWTKIRCNYAGSTYTGGRVMYVTFEMTAQIYTPPTGSMATVNLNNTVSATFGNTSSIQYIGLDISDSPFSNSNLVDDTLINQNQEIIDSQKENTQAVKDNTQATKDQTATIKDDNVDGANSSAGDFFSGFKDNSHGLTGIIISPLNLINSLTSSSCSSVPLILPFLTKNNTLSLPCMGTIYNQYFGSIYSLYQTLTFGLIAYYVCIKIFALVKGFQNPDDDKIEVMDL